MNDFESRRTALVENQLRPSRIDDPRLLAAMGSVPREAFLPKALRGVAYSDEDVDLGDGRRLIEALALAKLVQAARPTANDVGLVIGCDTGYSAAVLSKLVATVFLTQPGQTEVDRADALLSELGCDNVVTALAGPLDGKPDQAPFDVIVLAGSVDSVPPGLLSELGDGGRLAAVIRQRRAGKVTLFTRIGDSFGRSAPFDAAIPPLRGLVQAPDFVF